MCMYSDIIKSFKTIKIFEPRDAKTYFLHMHKPHLDQLCSNRAADQSACVFATYK